MVYLTWLFWVVVAVAVVVAARAFIGRREQASGIGLLVSGTVFLGATVLMATLGTTPSGRPLLQIFESQDAAAEAAARFAAAQRRSQQLAQELSEARQTEAEEQTRVARFAPQVQLSPPGAAAWGGDQAGPQWLLSSILLVLLIVNGAALLLANGPPEWIRRFGNDPLRDEQIAGLDQLAGLVWSGSYRQAVARGAEILELKLWKAELLDLLFLRAYAAVQVYAFPEDGETSEYRRGLLDEAVRDLQQVVDVGPRRGRGQSLYLLALAHAFAGRDEDALACFKRARELLDANALPFAHNESVCLLRRAEQHLSVGDTQQAEACFDRVSILNKLGAAVAQVRIKIALIDLRGAMGRKATDAAQTTLERITRFTGLTSEQRATMQVIGIELNARAALASGDVAAATREAEKFVASHMPTGLPPLDDDVVAESFSPLLDTDLAFPRSVYSGILFILAIARCLNATRGQKALTEAESAAIAEPLLRALQFQPRDRELLAGIGGLYYWTRRDLRVQARDWIESAVTMGVESRYARLILSQDKAEEASRRGVLDLFRSTSARFLRDPALAVEMRRALVEELSRFQEFAPMLIALQDRPEYEPEEPTVINLRNRAKYLSTLMENAMRQGQVDSHARLGALHGDYVRSLATLEQSVGSLEVLERQVIGELGSVLTLR